MVGLSARIRLSSLALSYRVYHWCIPVMVCEWAFPRPCPLVGLRGGCGASVVKLHTNMASQKKAKLNESKRPLSDSDSETETPNPSAIPNSFNSPRFIVIQSQDPSKPVTKLSPFIIEKQLSSILGTPKSVKKLKDQTILVECLSNQQASNLLKHTKFFDLNVKIFPHPSLNSCKGVIRCRELNFCNSLQEIKVNLKQQGVTDVRRISVRRDGEQKLTNTYILTFSSPVLPISIKIGFQIVKVDVYVPNPLRCFRCQRYGHHISKCPNEETCSKCAHQGPDHDSSTCSNPLHCINCKALPFLESVLHGEKKKKYYQLSTIIMLAFQMLKNYLNSVRKLLLVLAMQVLLVRHLKRMTAIPVKFLLKSSFKNFLM